LNAQEGLAWIAKSQLYLREPYYTEYVRSFLNEVGALPGERVLDCGIGTGETTAFEVAKQRADIFGVDVNAVLLNACKLNAASRHLRVRNTLAEFQRLPYRDEVFDKVYSFATTWYVADLNLALAEMHRVLKPGGILIFDVINTWHPFQLLLHIHHKLCSSRPYVALRIANRIRQSRHVDGLLAQLASPQWKNHLRSRAQIAVILKSLHLEFQMKGFFVVLPLALPGLGEKGNLCRYSAFLSYQVHDTPVLKELGAKLVFVCRKAMASGRNHCTQLAFCPQAEA
jgi:SAM-dependent methyltransferase